MYQPGGVRLWFAGMVTVVPDTARSTLRCSVSDEWVVAVGQEQRRPIRSRPPHLPIRGVRPNGLPPSVRSVRFSLQPGDGSMTAHPSRRRAPRTLAIAALVVLALSACAGSWSLNTTPAPVRAVHA